MKKFIILFLLFFTAPSLAVMTDADFIGTCGDYHVLTAVFSVTCNNGTYLPKNSSACTACLSGYECPGGVFEENIPEDQGLEEIPGVNCSIGYYLPANANACSICPINNICSGGTYTPGANNQGITACASGTFAPTGSAVCYPHLFHVGNLGVMYMKSTKRTTPSFNARIGNDIFYINMTTTRTKMNKDSDHYFHVDWGDNHYYVCDDTTCPQ